MTVNTKAIHKMTDRKLLLSIAYIVKFGTIRELFYLMLRSNHGKSVLISILMCVLFFLVILSAISLNRADNFDISLYVINALINVWIFQQYKKLILMAVVLRLEILDDLEILKVLKRIVNGVESGK